MHQMKETYGVIISGGGPVGLGLAIDLGQRGISVAVFERHLVPPRIPKGQNLTQRTMEHMAAWGVETAIRDAKTIPKGVGIGGLTAYGSLFSGYHYDWFNRASVADFYYTENERLPQYETEAVLRNRVAELESVDFFSGWTTGRINQSDDAVALSVSNGNETKSISAEYLIGCDGSRSNVRDRSGITETIQDHDRPMALIVFESPELFDLIKVFENKQFYNVLQPDMAGYWMFFGLVEWGKSFFFHAPVPSDTDRDNFDFEKFICRAVGRDFQLKLTHVGFWDLRISTANQYRDNRIFIAGDAAHSHPPYGGYGINTGFEDARNLGWKLSAQLKGWAGSALLDSYHEERAPVFASTAKDFINKFISDDRAFLEKFDPEKNEKAFNEAWQNRSKSGKSQGISTFAPHYSSSAIVIGGDRASTSAKGQHTFTACPGHHFAPQKMADGSSTADHLSTGFTLFRFTQTDDIANSFRDAAQNLGIPLSIVSAESELAEIYGNANILVRPDHFVAWVGTDTTDPHAVLSAAVGT